MGRLIEAARLHRDGHLAAAAAAYAAILRDEPDDAEALRFLGVLALQQGKVLEGTAHLERALALRPHDVATITNLGDAACAAGNEEAAAIFYRRALQRDSQWLPALRALGKLLFRQGDAHAAVRCLRAAVAIDADHFPTQALLALSLDAAAERSEAIEALERALSLHADQQLARRLAGWYVDASFGHLNAMRPSEALHCAMRAIALQPDCAVAYTHAAAAQLGRNDMDEALGSCERALALDPSLPRAFMIQGDIFAARGERKEAIAAYETGLAVAPTDPEILTRLAHVWETEDVDRAIALNERAAASASHWYAPHANLAHTYFLAGKNDAGMAAARAALALAPDHPDSHLSLGEALLRAGQYREGLSELRWHWHGGAALPTRFRDVIPYWTGEHREGDRLLVGRDQGLGDMIMMLRYIPWLKARGFAHVTLEVPAELFELARDVPGYDQLMCFGDPIDTTAYDVFVPATSLPLVFETRLDSIPAPIPYLKPRADAVEHWDRRLHSGAARKIGIVWSGNPQFRGNAVRSCRLDHFAPIAALEGVMLYSLQFGATDAVRAASFSVTDATEGIGSLADTAALLSNLDLLLTIDSAPAHLAGALGLPVWVLLSTRSHWIYHLDTETTPWYPTMRLFRQEKTYTWDPVFERVRAALSAQKAP